MKVPSNRIIDIYRYYTGLLQQVYEHGEASQFLYLLLEEFAGIQKTHLFTEPETTINESELLNIHFAVKDLLRFVPVQQIIGYTPFYNCRIEVNSHVLIPRPETEYMVDLILKENLNHRRVLDIGTGSGAIAIALKKHLPSAKVYAVEYSVQALAKARENAVINETEIGFIHLDLMDPSAEKSLPGDLDLIVSNPPYVRESEKKFMKNNVLEHEPAMALFVPDNNALLFYERIANLGRRLLGNRGILWVEINEALGAETLELFSRLKYQTHLIQDLNERDRFIKAEKE